MAVKILQLCAVDFTLDKFLAPLCLHLQERGFDVTAACTESAFMEPLRERGLRCVDLPIERSMNLKAHVRSYRALSEWLANEHFDIVHVHTPIASLIGRFAATRRGVPVCVYTAHGFYFHDDMPWHKRGFHVALEWLGARCHDYLFTQSEEDRQTAIRLGIARDETVRTIGNGVDMHRFDPARFSEDDRAAMRTSLGIEADACVLGVIARLVREKGCFELFEAAAELVQTVPGFRLLVIGGALESDHDDSTTELNAHIDALGIRDKVVFTGQRRDIPELLNAVDVYTLPSWREGMPRSVIEAMAMGKPCVVTDIRGCREEVLHGETGFVIPVRDGKCLAERCRGLLEDQLLAVRMGEAGLARARELYDEQRVIERQVEVFRMLLEQKGIAPPA